MARQINPQTYQVIKWATAKEFYGSDLQGGIKDIFSANCTHQEGSVIRPVYRIWTYQSSRDFKRYYALDEDHGSSCSRYRRDGIKTLLEAKMVADGSALMCVRIDAHLDPQRYYECLKPQHRPRVRIQRAKLLSKVDGHYRQGLNYFYTKYEILYRGRRYIEERSNFKPDRYVVGCTIPVEAYKSKEGGLRFVLYNRV